MKRSFKKIALLGIAAGLCAINEGPLVAKEVKEQLGGELFAKLLSDASSTTSTKDTKSSTTPAKTDKDSKESEEEKYKSQNMGYHLVTEEELVGNLNAKGLKLYLSLDDEGKLLARKVASQLCNGTNDCRGLNACKTDNNDCAGQGSCRGKSKCAIGDKNLAVKLAAKHMAEKRGEKFNNININGN